MVIAIAPSRFRPSVRGLKFVILPAMAIWAFIGLWFVAGLGLSAIPASLHPPGRMVDVGGRRMHIVCQGPMTPGRPEVLFESGAFGFSADWAVVQAALAGRGVRACAYDRAGLGFSDPGPLPRDGLAIAGDLRRLLGAAGEPGPFILVSHSMAGLHVRLFADRNPELITGLVLVDSTTPEAMSDPATRDYVRGFTSGTEAAAIAGSLGLMEPLKGTGLANKIGLTGEAEAEKRHMFASGAYNRWAAAEVREWPAAAAQARASGPLDPDWPVAVVIAGRAPPALQRVQTPPATASRHGYVCRVAKATHDGLLGPDYADAIVDAVAFVERAAGQPAQPPVMAQGDGCVAPSQGAGRL